jgi:tetraacyldisaccharide 4'-kinase
VDPAGSDAARDGDEPVLLARSLPEVPVVVGPDRLAASTLALARGADVLVLDDGFQHRRLRRDFDVVLWDRAAERSRGRLLPAGFLREPLSALGRADGLVLVDRGDGWPEPPPGGPDAALRVRLVSGPCQELPADARLHALSGLADPESFERSLAAQGFTVVGATRYPDHHPFTGDEIHGAARRAASQGADLLAITAKDRARWPIGGRSGLPSPAVFDLDAEVDDGDLLERIEDAIGGT